ncbi:DUF3293 domain-containing protein [Vibrio gangliei]|uniref:DUF3293 domain-containing protein n=1 Tax=Vibrio gangliei TaxID=2077090 RepID=UPI000D01D958|nr:DUF3293 domain-containing protein [Vibrio gangliei]
MDQDLVHQYEKTTYQVAVGGRQFDLKIDHHHSEFEIFCQASGIGQWAIITAFNPFSYNTTTEADNQLANQKLQQELTELGFMIGSGDGIPSPDSDWDTEYGFFIANIDLERAKALGEKYQQNAIVFGDVGRDIPPNLIKLV